MKRKVGISILILIVIISSCNKNRERVYNGTIVGVADGCFLEPSQYPYIIKFDDVSELEDSHPIRIIASFDSSCIAIIPDQYKIAGKKIRFSFRKRNENEEFTCNANVGYYEVVVTEVLESQ